MKNKILLLLAIISTCLSTNAQIKIDFNAGDGNKSYNCDGYTAWYLESEINSGGSQSKTINGVKITISHGANTDAGIIYRTWNNNNLKAGKDYLINDGLTGKAADGSYLKTGKMSIKLSLTGLKPGTHSIQAFHNYPENLGGVTNPVLPTINVSLGDNVVLSDISQTFQAETLAESTSTYVKFDVASNTDVIEITYYTAADSNVEYARNNFFINGIIIDGSDIDNIAQNPTPANLDWHVADNNGTVTLSWDTPKNGVDNYIVYFDTDKESVTNGSASSQPITATSLTKKELSPLNRYYWRVDVVRGGVTYKGDVWGFQPRRLAFPGADGAGKYAVGGRGYNGNGDVYHVTNLNDSGAGSLRYGIESATGPRTIVFDVAGVISLTSDLKCNKPNITVAGQTAPGIGILLRDDSYSADSEDGITRFMRFRFGHGDDWKPESGVGNSNVGNAAGIQTDYHIMDHCLLAWGSDETFASRGAKNITFQHSLIGESLNQNGHDKYYDSEKNPNVQHGYAATIGGETGSYHHNLLAHNEGRNWSMSGGLLGNEFAGKMNIYNNVVYNWHGRTNDGGTHNGNFVNNYYKMMSTGVNDGTRQELFEATHEDNYQGSQEYYVAGNIRRNKDGSETEDKEGVTYVSVIDKDLKEGDAGYPDYPTFVSVPYDCWNVESKSVSEIESAQSAFKNVLSDVGCNFQQLDNNEKRLIQETRDGTYTKTGSRSKLLGLIDKESDSEGWGGLGMVEATRPDNWDSDGDGIPAWFETAKGWSDAAANNNADNDGDYYTDLEEYLNWVAVPHFYNMANDGTVSALKTGTNHTITLADYFAGYTSPNYDVVSNGGATTSISNGVLTYNFPANASKLATIQVKATQDGISLTRSFNFFIDGSNIDEPETPVVTPEGDEYVLSYSTSKDYTTTEDVTYTFVSNGKTFTMNNSDNKKWSYGYEDGVKYTKKVQYTIGIPTGIQVDYITFKGYDNYSGTDAYLLELNGTEYNPTDYVFPQKDANDKYIVAEHTIQLAKPATGTLTFTPADNQVVWVITLYTSEIKIELGDKRNTMEEVADGTGTVSETGTIKWVMSSGNEEDAVYSSNIVAGFNGYGSITLTNIKINGKEEISSKEYTETKFQPTAKDKENLIDFKVTLNDGYTFKPTKVEFISSRIGTNEGTLTTSFNNNGNIEELGSFRPQRSKDYKDGSTVDASPYYTKGVYEIGSESITGTFGIRFKISGVATGKDYGLCNIIITGTLEYESSTTKKVVTLDEMATVHNLPKAENVTVKMKRGLTKEKWNTFCVPFNLTKEQLQTALSDKYVEIVEYTRQDGTMLYFTDTDKIVAGTPYLIKPSSFSCEYSDDMTPITFEGVDLEAANVKSNSREVASEVCPGIADYSFVGTYVRYIMETDGTELGLNSKNKLAKPAASTNIMRGLRGFFRYNAGNGAGAKVVINGTLTSIDEIDGGTAGAKGVYHVSGRYVRSEWNNGSGLPRGLYIVNGQKMVK